ncbi:hypothetical protein ANAPRD1_00475 [Anaplasma phagocytophilum]|nr:hypothetical protein ANAPRD1_00475 [Anaplasma phagocytophilum]
MMLLLGRLINLLLLLPRPRVKILFSLLRRLKLPTPLSMGRFVLESMLREVRQARLRHMKKLLVRLRKRLSAVVLRRNNRSKRLVYLLRLWAWKMVNIGQLVWYTSQVKLRKHPKIATPTL